MVSGVAGAQSDLPVAATLAHGLGPVPAASRIAPPDPFGFPDPVGCQGGFWHGFKSTFSFAMALFNLNCRCLPVVRDTAKISSSVRQTFCAILSSSVLSSLMRFTTLNFLPYLSTMSGHLVAVANSLRGLVCTL